MKNADIPRHASGHVLDVGPGTSLGACFYVTLKHALEHVRHESLGEVHVICTSLVRIVRYGKRTTVR